MPKRTRADHDDFAARVCNDRRSPGGDHDALWRGRGGVIVAQLSVRDGQLDGALTDHLIVEIAHHVILRGEVDDEDRRFGLPAAW